MKKSSEWDISVSSFLELKNQVLKKKSTVDAAKSGRDETGEKSTAAPWLKQKNVTASKVCKGGSIQVSEKRASSPESVDEWEKIHESLTRKSRLYEQLQRGEGPSRQDGSSVAESHLIRDGEGAFLVDFDRKGWDVERKEYAGLPDFALHPSEGLPPLDFLASLYGIEIGKQLVEYVDEFGRTRLIKPEERIRLEKEREDSQRLLLEFYSNAAGGATVGPSHYEADREIRSKGIGFFAFAKDERERQEQLRELMELRKQTVEERRRFLMLSEERRLKKMERREKAEKRRKALDQTLL